MKIGFIFFLSLINLTLCSQVMWQIKKDTVIKWYYFDGDEFNGPSVDEEKWIPAYSYSQVNYRFDYLMKKERLEFSNGICKFMCYRDTGLYEVPGWQLDSAFKKEYAASLVNGNKFRYLYSCGNVWSKAQYGKGYFEMRFKTTDSYGMWPAFWLYGNNQKDEIDFFELKGERRNSIHVATHCPSGCDKKYKNSRLFKKPFSGWIKTTRPLNEAFNVLAGEWQDGYIKWYLNGEGIAYFEGDFASQQMSLIIGTGPAKDGFGFAPGVNSKSYFPNSFDVDYVRVWYKEEKKSEKISGKKHTEFSYFKTDDQKNASLKKKISYMYSKKALDNELLTVSVLPIAGKKLLLTSMGKNNDFEFSVYEVSGKQILNQKIKNSFNEINLEALTKEKSVKVQIVTPFRSVEETITLQ